MDYQGLARIGKLPFPVDRELMDAEISNEIGKIDTWGCSPRDELSVIKINSCFMELVDRWYSHKGHAIFYSCGPFVIGSLFIVVVAMLAFEMNEVDIWWVFLLSFVMGGGLLLFGWTMFRCEAFQLTHYPVRFNRKNRMVYAILPHGGVAKAKWDDLFIYLATNRVSFFRRPFYEIRAHVLADDRKTVLQTFSLAYPIWGERDHALGMWEFIRRYMDEPTGYKRNSELVELCMPIDKKRERLSFCIIRGMAIFASSQAIQLIMSPLFVLVIWGRMVAIYTSKVPEWPADIASQCHAPKNDPYAKTGEDNTPFTFFEGTWPIICFCMGSLISISIITWAAYTYAGMIMALF